MIMAVAILWGTDDVLTKVPVADRDASEGWRHQFAALGQTGA